MAFFRKLLFRRPPDGLVEVSDNVFVFSHCLSIDFFEEDELKQQIGSIINQLNGRYSIDSFMIFNFEGGKKDSQISRIFSDHDISAMGYPRNYEGCPLLTMEMIHHFLRSSESWLSLGQDNFLIMHSEQGGWPVLAFALATLLIYLQRYTDEAKALEMVYRQAPSELVELFSPLDPMPSQLRYLKYMSRRHASPELWPPADMILYLNCAIIRKIPNFDGQGGCRPIFRIYGPDPLIPHDKSAKVLFSIPKTSDFVQLYRQEDCEIIKVNVRCPVQGDIVLECVSLDEDLEREVMVFRIMFNTAFVENNLLVLNRDEIDILWDTKHRFPADFRIEVIFSEMDATTSICMSEISSEEKESLSKVKDVFNHLDWSIKSNQRAADASEHRGPNNAQGDFEQISLEEPDTHEITPELSHSSQNFYAKEAVGDAYLLQKSQVDKFGSTASELGHGILAPKLQDNEATQVNETNPEHIHSSMPNFDIDEDPVADAYSLPNPEVLAASSRNHEVFEDASSIENGFSSDMPVMNFQDSETGDGAATEWSDSNTNMFMSDSPPSSVQSSPPRFDEGIISVGRFETQSQPTELQRC